jgi:hypothetical protein
MRMIFRLAEACRNEFRSQLLLYTPEPSGCRVATRRFVLAALSAGFAGASGRSLQHSRAAGVDPEATFMTEPPGDSLPGKADARVPSDLRALMAFIRRPPDTAMAKDRPLQAERECRFLPGWLSDAVSMYGWITHHGPASETLHQGGHLDMHRGAKRRGRVASMVLSWARKLRIVPNSFQLRPALPQPHGEACSCSARPRHDRCRSS